MSELAHKMAGTFIPEVKKPPVTAWLQEQMRCGFLRSVVDKFVNAQVEVLDGSRVQVDEVTPERVRCRIPRFTADHESRRPLRDDVEFDLNPLTGHASRRDG